MVLGQTRAIFCILLATLHWIFFHCHTTVCKIDQFLDGRLWQQNAGQTK